MNIESSKRLIGDRSENVADRLSGIVRLAQAEGAGREEAELLRSLSRQRGEDVIVRGYAAWGAERIAPSSVAPGTVYHIAQLHPEADDRNPGTPDKPWRTIQHAAERLRPGDTVRIHEGLYREFVRPFLGGTGYDAMITYVAADGERPVITAADRWEAEWRPLGGGRWATACERLLWDRPERWPHPQYGPMHRCEQIIVDGVPYRHAADKAELAAQPGCFWTDDEAGEILIRLDGGSPPSRRLIERAVRQQCFAPAVRGLGYIRVEGLIMLYGAAPESTGANWDVVSHRSVMSLRSGHHWIVAGNTIEWGNAQGMDIGGEGWGADVKHHPIVSELCGHHRIVGNRVNDHGVAGIVGWDGRQTHLLLEDNETNRNCRKGNGKAYEGGGLKLHNAKDCLIRRHRSIGNLSYGIWLDHRCERNRITECIAVNNVTNGIFHEVSPGPVLIDSNVVIETRGSALEDGIYSHDGNEATVVNNYIEGCDCGIRMRNLFGRLDDGIPTTTSRNRVWNNFIVNCTAAVSFNPDVPRATDNRSDGNILWRQGMEAGMRLENEEGCSVCWENTAVGAALGKSGEGKMDIPLDVWTDVVGNDRDSIHFPGRLLFPEVEPEKIRDRLLQMREAGDFVPSGDPAEREAMRGPAAALIGAALPRLAGGRRIRDIRLAPDSCLQLWLVDGGPVGLTWSGDRQFEWLPSVPAALMEEPATALSEAVTAAAGETVQVQVPASARIMYAGLEAAIEEGRLAMTAPSDGAGGEYGVVLQDGGGWRRLEIHVVPGYAIERIGCVMSPSRAVVVDIENRRSAESEATVTVALGGRRYECLTVLQPNRRTEVAVPVEFDGAGEAIVRVGLPGFEAASAVPVSFCSASRAAYGGWACKYPVEGIPGGAFPEGLEAFALYAGGLRSEWGAVYDGKGLHLLVEVYDPIHWQPGGQAGLSGGDSIQLLLQGLHGRPALLIDAALHMATGEPLLYRAKSPDPDAFPAGKADDMAADIYRLGDTTIYRLSIPWPMIGYEKAPPSGSAISFSLVVNNRDGADQEPHGLQWFFGIRREGKGETGTLWLA